VCNLKYPRRAVPNLCVDNLIMVAIGWVKVQPETRQNGLRYRQEWYVKVIVCQIQGQRLKLAAVKGKLNESQTECHILGFPFVKLGTSHQPLGLFLLASLCTRLLRALLSSICYELSTNQTDKSFTLTRSTMRMLALAKFMPTQLRGPSLNGSMDLAKLAMFPATQIIAPNACSKHTWS